MKLFIVLILSIFTSCTASLAKDRIAFLEGNGLITRAYDGILNRSLQKFGLNTTVSINPAKDNDGYSIVIIGYSEAADYGAAFKSLFPSRAVPSDARSSLMNNALATEGHTIYVGEVYFSQLIVAAYNDALALTQTSIETDGGASDYNHSLQKNYAITSVMRFDNLQLLNQYPGENGATFKGEAAVVAMARAVATSADEADADNPIHASLSGVLVPLIAHELAHLDEKIDVAGMFEFIERWRIQKVKSSEDAADARAAAVTAKYLERLKLTNNADFIAALRGVNSYVDVMKDQLLVEVTASKKSERFHDLRTSDLFVELLHANCTDDPEMANLSPLNPGRVLSGRQKSIPDMVLFTKSELNELNTDLVERPNSLSHSHNFRRARLLLDLIKVYDEAFIVDDLKTFEILESSVAGTPSKYRSKTLPTFPIPPSELESKLSDSYSFEDAAWCPSQTCRIGSPRDGSKLGGFVEIVGDSSGTYRLTWYAPIGLGSDDEYPEQMVRMTSFFLAVTGLLEPMVTASETVRANRIQCQVGAGIWEDEDHPYFIGMWSLFRPEWIAVQMQSKAALGEP